MPSRKTATPSSRPKKRPAAPTSSARSVAPPNVSLPARASAVAVVMEEFRDVTAEVQRRYDTADDDVPTPPSSLDLDRHPSAARSGSEQLKERRRKRNATSPEIAAGDLDAALAPGCRG